MPDSMRRIPDREPTIGEIAQALCSTPEEVSMSMEAARKPASCKAPLSDETGKPLALEDCLGATAEESDKAIDRVLLRELLASWSREKDRSSFFAIFYGQNAKRRGQSAAYFPSTGIQARKQDLKANAPGCRDMKRTLWRSFCASIHFGSMRYYFAFCAY